MPKQKVVTDRFSYRSSNGNIEGFRISTGKDFSMPIIFCRGGNRHFGAIDQDGIATWLVPLAEAGYTVYATQYSGGPNSEGSDEFGGSDVQDVLALLDVMTNDGAYRAGEFLGILGFSRGVMEACLAMQQGLPVTKAVFVSGVYDLRNVAHERPDVAEMIARDHLFEMYDKALAKRSPLAFVCDLPPIPYLLLHSLEDERVNVAQAKAMAAALGGQATLKLFPGDDHGLYGIADVRNVLIVDWFKEDVSTPLVG